MEGRGGVVQGKHQSYTLSAASEDECDNWVHAIRSGHVGAHVLTFTHCQTGLGFMGTFVKNKDPQETCALKSKKNSSLL